MWRRGTRCGGWATARTPSTAAASTGGSTRAGRRARCAGPICCRARGPGPGWPASSRAFGEKARGFGPLGLGGQFCLFDVRPGLDRRRSPSLGGAAGMARRGQVSDGDMAAGRYNGASAISQPLIINGGLNWQLFSSIRLTVYIVLDMSTAYPATNPHYRICTLHSYIVL